MDVPGDPEDSGFGGKNEPEAYVHWTEEGMVVVRLHRVVTFFATMESCAEDGV